MRRTRACDKQGDVFFKRAKSSKQASGVDINSADSTHSDAAAVSKWTFDLVCGWLKGVLDSDSAKGLFETEEKERLVNYFRAQRINGHVLLNFTQEEKADLLKEAVPAQRGPQSFLSKAIQELVECSSIFSDQISSGVYVPYHFCL